MIDLKKAQFIFEHAISLENNLIHDYLKAACKNDSDLLNTVLTLVQSHQSIDNDTQVSIETNLFKLLSTASENKHTIQQNSILFNSERYQSIKKIGDGGMGSVFLCSRKHEGFTQNVAIKVLHKVEYSTETIQRFNLEKQILAQLEHPNITQFIDTDNLADGTPFVVMEYTPGLTIDVYCKQHNLKIEQKLRLFIQLCEAVQHAHQNLIIHRDIKPSNILVTESGTIKLIDFGIAKDLSNAVSLHTQTGHHVMTPAYASPEQLLKKPLSTSTDIYSLGLVLYELLTGSRPYDLTKISPGQYEKLLLEKNIELPSKRMASQKSHISADLDAITLKTLQTKINDRYSSVVELIADIKRHLQHLPVLARKPNLIYKTNKFIQRNRLAVITALSFCVLTSVFIIQIISEKEAAEKERTKANTISDSFILAFKNADPTQTLGEDIKAIHIMDQVANNIITNHTQNPLLLEELSITIAAVYYNMGSYDKALKFVELASNNKSILTPSQVTDWAILKAKIENTTERFDDAIATLNDVNSYSKDQELNIKFAQAVALLGKGQTVDSKTIFDDLKQQVLPNHPLFGEVCLTRFNLLHSQDAVQEQEKLLKKCLNNQNRLSSQQELINNEIILNLARSHQSKFNYEKSNEYYLSSLKITEKIFGKQHITQSAAHKGLGWNYKEQKKYAESIQSQNMALAISEKYYGKGHPNTTSALFNLGHVYSNLKEYEQAFELYNSAINIMLENGLKEETKLAFYFKAVGHLQNDLGLYTEAEKNIKHSISIFSLKQGSYVYRMAEMQVLLSHILYNQVKTDEAKALMLKALPNMYTMHEKGDYYQVLAEELDAILNNKAHKDDFSILVNE